MTLATTVIFIITYAGIIFTRLPWVNIDRPSAAFFGAVAMILTGVLTLDEAVRAIDFNTILLLLGMMILIAVLELDGFFTYIASKTIHYSRTAAQLLTIIVFSTGISSAFLVNDAVVLLFTPVIIRICRSGGLNPMPYLVAEIMASNIGSAMTITGNPQNILIGMQSGIAYGRFLLYLLPVSFTGMLVIIALVRVFYRNDFRSRAPLEFHNNDLTYNFASMKVSVPIFLLVILLFFLSPVLRLPIPLIALTGASLVLIFGKIRPSKVIQEVDWVLLVFFSGLFIVVHAVEKTGLLEPYIRAMEFSDSLAGIRALHGLSLVLSQVVSNVPYTILMLPVLKPQAGEALWLALASASTLAGNATIVGAMANLIVIESARKDGVRIRFFPFLKIGITITLATMAISVCVLYAEAALGLFAR